MPKPIALLDSNSENDRIVSARLVAACLKNSSWDFVGGRSGRYFFDVDDFGKDSPSDDTGVGPKELAEAICRAVTLLRQDRDVAIDRLAFIERDAGPCGMLPYQEYVGVLAQLPTCCVRPYRRVLASAIKGLPFRVGERLLLVNDVATDGAILLEAAAKIWSLGATIAAALVVFDRSEGATERLAQYDVPLYSLANRETLLLSGAADEQLAERSDILFELSSALISR